VLDTPCFMSAGIVAFNESLWRMMDSPACNIRQTLLLARGPSHTAARIV
jgi:hypothetical protein